MVDFIVHAPYGAWPTAMYNYYDYDQAHIEYYAKLCATEEGLKKYIKEWVMPREEEIIKRIKKLVIKN
jgi:glutaconate CoA-transferase subunit A